MLLGPKFGMRHVQALLIFLAIVSAFVGRYNVAVAVVAMTKTHSSGVKGDDSVNPNFPVKSQ